MVNQVTKLGKLFSKLTPYADDVARGALNYGDDALRVASNYGDDALRAASNGASPFRNKLGELLTESNSRVNMFHTAMKPGNLSAKGVVNPYLGMPGLTLDDLYKLL